ncbi:MAG: polysaccharide biosynthesis C-terminal domain-containing protein, partial [Paramuribaculum sp.]|nr:polysaccharide biosynthesis C-terminal domain-containing protein [Paramuribaculum sp.]
MNHTKTATSGDVKRLGSGPIGRLLWDYSIPAVVGMLVMSLYNVVDRVFIGQGVGPDGITGLAITFPVMNISAALGVLIGSGASARVSILLGSKDEHGAEMTLGNSLTLIVVNAVVYLSLMWIFLDDILRLFGADEASLPYAHDYLIYLLPGMLLMNTGFSLNNVMRASGYPVKAMNSMFIGAGLNVVLDALFIFVLDMGIKGAAIATDISMGVFALFVLRHFSLRSSTLHFRRHSFRLHRKIVWGIIGIGAAPSLVNFASCLINIIINKSLYEYGGNNAVAAAGIFVTYTSLIC